MSPIHPACSPCAFLSALDEPGSERIAGEFGAVAHLQLLQDVRAVPLDGLDADHQQRGISLDDRPSAISLTISDSRAVRMLPGSRSPRRARCRYSRISAVRASG